VRELHKLSAHRDDFRVQTQSASAMKAFGTIPTPSVVRLHSNMFNLDQASYEQMARSPAQGGT